MVWRRPLLFSWVCDVSIGDDIVDFVPRYTREQSARADELAHRLKIYVDAEDHTP